MPVTEWHYSMDSIEAANKIPTGVISEQSHALGMKHGEPLIVAMDAAIQFASVYRCRYGCGISNDGVLGEHWLSWVKGIRGLLNGDGAVAMNLNRTTDSKDNGAVEEMFWKALSCAGYTEKDL